MEKYKKLHYVAIAGLLAVCLVPCKAETFSNLLLHTLLYAPFALMAIWAAIEYKRSGKKEKADWLSVSAFGVHPYITTAVLVFCFILFAIETYLHR